MCTSPKIIKNRSNHYNIYRPLTLVVPCGCCEECRSTNRNGWFVRSYFEWKNSAQTYFYTLTYDCEHLPHCCGAPCFSKRDVQLFLKRFRSHLSILGVRLKYLITCEYGETFHRPHYHALFFLDRPINSYHFFSLVEKSWQYGFVKYGNNVGLVDSSSGIKYVTKYVSKDFGFVDVHSKIKSQIYLRYDSLFRYMQSRGLVPNHLVFDARQFSYVVRSYIHGALRSDELESLSPLACKFINKVNSLLASASPFHLQSTKLGSCLIEKLSEFEKDNECVVIPNRDAEYIKYRLPRYIKRCLWMDCVENEVDGKFNRFVLNEVGLQHSLKRLSILVQDEQIRLSNVLNSWRQLSLGVLPVLKENTECPHFDNLFDLQFFLKNFDLDVEQLAIYNVVFRGRLCPASFNDVKLTSSIVLDNYQDYYEQCVRAVSEIDFGKMFLDVTLYRSLRYRLWNYHPYFQPYAQASILLDCLSNYFKMSVSASKEHREHLQRSLREYLLNV